MCVRGLELRLSLLKVCVGKNDDYQPGGNDKSFHWNLRVENIRRTKYFFVYFDEIGFIDISLFLQGTAELSAAQQIFGLSILKGEGYPISFEQLQILSEIPSGRWTPVSAILEQFGIELELIHDLARKGLILSDTADESFAELRERDELLAVTQWNIHGALYHSMTKWKDMHLNVDLPNDLQELQEINAAGDEQFGNFVELFGKPPEHFYSRPDARLICDLPLIKKEGNLYEVLLRRKTTRAYDRQQPMKLEDLSVILYYVWGCHGYSPVWQDIIGLKKTSPSGGDLHPVEVYPLISNVTGLNTGLYHYNTKDHSLELLVSLNQDEASELANEFTAGQQFPRSSHVLFIMTARFYRNFWKYRQHQKAYSVIFMDAAHLSQTFYLVCTELGLGAFITAAINSINIEQKLGLDGITEGAVAICGCGEALESLSLDPDFFPYVPRETQI